MLHYKDSDRKQRCEGSVKDAKEAIRCSWFSPADTYPEGPCEGRTRTTEDPPPGEENCERVWTMECDAY